MNCQICGEAFYSPESDALETETFCSRECEKQMNTCQQCFDGYDGDKGDGFCSDTCLKQHDQECYGTETEATDDRT